MEVIGLRLPLVRPGDDLVGEILKACRRIGGLKNGDVVVVCSKAVAVAEGRIVNLSEIRPSARARELAKKAGISERLAEVVMREADRILGVGGGAVLTIKNGVLCANAGVDLSNAPPGCAVLLPADPNGAAERIRREIREREGKRVGVVISDSMVRPLRLGVVGQAIGFAGFEPVVDCRGSRDLFGRTMRITFIALADLIASAAELVMGETSERRPAAVVRGACVKLTEAPELSPIVERERDLYSAIFRF